MKMQPVVTDAKDEPEVKVLGIDLAEAARRAWLAGIGAVASAQDEVVALVHKMIERGEVTEKEGRKWVEQVANKAKEVPQKSLKSAGGGMHSQMDALLDRLGVPTKADLERMDLPTRADIEALSEKVTALSKKIDQLRKVEKEQSAVLEKVERQQAPKPERVTTN